MSIGRDFWRDEGPRRREGEKRSEEFDVRQSSLGFKNEMG